MKYPNDPNDVSVLMEVGELPLPGQPRPQNGIISKLNTASSKLAAARQPMQDNSVKSFQELASAMESGARVTIKGVVGIVQGIQLEDGSRKSWNVTLFGMVRENGQVKQGTTTVHVRFP